jgi:hypothetical protein
MHELFFSKSSLSAPRNDDELKRESYLVRLKVEHVGGSHQVTSVEQAFNSLQVSGKFGAT